MQRINVFQSLAGNFRDMFVLGNVHAATHGPEDHHIPGFRKMVSTSEHAEFI
jgi:hypothetical protein